MALCLRFRTGHRFSGEHSAYQVRQAESSPALVRAVPQRWSSPGRITLPRVVKMGTRPLADGLVAYHVTYHSFR